MPTITQAYYCAYYQLQAMPTAFDLCARWCVLVTRCVQIYRLRIEGVVPPFLLENCFAPLQQKCLMQIALAFPYQHAIVTI